MDSLNNELPNPRLFGKDPDACPGVNGSYPLFCHLLDTAVVISHLWQTRTRAGLKIRIVQALKAAGFNGDPATILMLAAGLHDIGKLNPWFQYQERMVEGTSTPQNWQAIRGSPSRHGCYARCCRRSVTGNIPCGVMSSSRIGQSQVRGPTAPPHSGLEVGSG